MGTQIWRLKLLEERIRGRGFVAGGRRRRWGRDEVPARERADFVLLGEYRAREPLALLIAGIAVATKPDYFAVGPLAVVHCPLRIDMYARIAPKDAMYA
jgi:hypothetical protein